MLMGRLLAIDYGKRRCGIAVTDSLRIAANPLTTVETGKLIEFVTDYCRTNDVDAVVVGKPMNLNGEPSASMASLTPMFNRLRKLLLPKAVVMFDERFTSVLAHKAMIDGGMKKSDRRDKGTVDMVSAAILLNDFLQSRQAGESGF